MSESGRASRSRLDQREDLALESSVLFVDELINACEHASAPYLPKYNHRPISPARRPPPPPPPPNAVVSYDRDCMSMTRPRALPPLSRPEKRRNAREGRGADERETPGLVLH